MQDKPLKIYFANIVFLFESNLFYPSNTQNTIQYEQLHTFKTLKNGHLRFQIGTYCKVTSSNTSRLEAHAAFFKLLMKGIFDPYVL